MIPGLPEAVEIHMGRLGQTGEQVAIAASLARRAGSLLSAATCFGCPLPRTA